MLCHLFLARGHWGPYPVSPGSRFSAAGRNAAPAAQDGWMPGAWVQAALAPFRALRVPPPRPPQECLHS